MMAGVTLKLRAIFLRVAAAALVLVMIGAAADARPKLRFGSSSKVVPGAVSKASPASGMSAALHGALLARSVVRATKVRIEKVYDLPAGEDATLPDGRHFDIGRMAKFFSGSTYVGYISNSEYIDLSTQQLELLLMLVGFNSVEELEQHLATKGQPAPTESAVVASGPAEPIARHAEAGAASGWWAAVAMLVGSFGLLGFIAYCLHSGWKNRHLDQPAEMTSGSGRMPRPPRFPVASAPVQLPRTAPAKSPVPPQLSTTRPPSGGQLAPTFRRAPRDLSHLIKAPTPAFSR